MALTLNLSFKSLMLTLSLLCLTSQAELIMAAAAMVCSPLLNGTKLFWKAERQNWRYAFSST